MMDIITNATNETIPMLHDVVVNRGDCILIGWGLLFPDTSLLLCAILLPTRLVLVLA